MIAEYRFTYLPCQFCVGKNHCEQCAAQIAELLARQPGVISATVDRPAQTLTVTHDGADLDALEDVLDAAGVFLS